MEINSTHLLTQAVKAVISAKFWERKPADIVDDLRFLRFNDDGVIALIDEILRGKAGSPDRLNDLLTEFNDREWQVADTIARLIERCDKISNLTNEDLQLIAWRKPSIRRELQDALNRHGQSRARIDKTKLKQIRDGIVDLNNAIDRAEHVLLHGERS